MDRLIGRPFALKSSIKFPAASEKKMSRTLMEAVRSPSLIQLQSILPPP
jgi:hypothetical protein